MIKNLKFSSITPWTGLFSSFFIVFCGVYLFHSAPPRGGLSEEGYGINPSSRKYFEYLRNHDPEQNLLPTRWKQDERDFADHLPQKMGNRSADWTQRGPFNIGGRTRAIALDITNENIILAGAVTGGLWRSTDGGNSWTHCTTPDQLHSVSCIIQDTRPGHTNTWYYGSGEEFYGVVSGTSFTSLFSGDGIFKSTDGGITWNPLASTQSGTPENILQNGSYDFIWRMAVDATNTAEDEIYAAVYNGIIRSTDGGNTWTNVLGFTSGASEFTDVMVTPEGVVYATFSDNSTNGGGFFRSENGIDWVSINPTQPEIANLRRTVMTYNPQNTDEVFFLGETLNNGQYDLDHFLYKYTYDSTDNTGAGGTWENRSANLPDTPCQLFTGINFDFATFRSQYSYDLTIAHHPTTDALFIGGINLHRSMDGFANDNEDWIGGYRCNVAQPYFYVYPDHHPDQHFILFSPSNPNVMFSANDGGVYKTNDCMADSVSWIPLNKGYIGSQFYTCGFEQGLSNSDIIMGGMQDNGTWVTDNTNFSSPWKELHADDGSFCAMPHGAQYAIVSSQSGRMMKKIIDAQANLQGTERIDPENAPSYLFINPFVLDPWNQEDIFIAANRSIWYLPNTSQINVTGNYTQPLPPGSWVQMPNSTAPLVSGSISCLDKPLTNNTRIYYGTTQGKAFRIDDCYGSDPVKTAISSTQFPTNGYVSSIATNDLNPDEVILSFSNYNKLSLFHSLDAGLTWTEVGGNLEENPDGTGSGAGVYSVEIYPSNPPQYFVGTSAGLFSTSSLDNSNTIWEMEGANTLGNVIINQIQARPYDGLIAVATHGSGMWSAQLEPVVGVGINQQDWSKETRVYPTAFQDAITIQSLEGNGNFKLYDVQGKCVITEKISGQIHTISGLQGLNKGMYLYTIETKKEKKSGKIIHE